MKGRTGLQDRPQLCPAPPQSGLRRRFPDFLPRLLSAIAMIVAASATAIAGGQWFACLWWAAALAIAWEWQGLIGGSRFKTRFTLAGVAVSVAAPLAGAALLWPAVTMLIVGSGAVSFVADPGQRLLAGFGVCYAGALVVALNLLRNSFPFGFESIVWLFAVVWGTDIMAYVGGRLVGGPKLWPRFSPSKTWAGFSIGVVSGSLAGLAVAPAPGRYGMYVLVGLVAGAIAQGGDLFESALKRRFGAKDSSRLIPGHGGAMDRLDGFLAAAVFAAILGVIRFGGEAPGAGLFRW